MRRLWRRLFGPRPAQPPVDMTQVLSDDWCCVCLVDLYVGEVYEVREHGGIGADEHEGGGSWVARTYCAEHAPPGALAPVPSDG